MPFLHILLNSPASLPITKTELDIGTLTKPYIDIAHCIRAALCVSHDLRNWVKVTIGFDQLGPLTITLDPRTIRYLGTDERSILHIILRAQAASNKTKQKIPHGVNLTQKSVYEVIPDEITSSTLFLIPAIKSTWQEALKNVNNILMYCSLHEDENFKSFTQYPHQYYKDYHRRDIAILEVVHTLDSLQMVTQKD